MHFAAFYPLWCVIYRFAKNMRAKRKSHSKKSYILKRAHIWHDFCTIYHKFFMVGLIIRYFSGSQ